MNEPRKEGMAQKEQRRSQPEASFTEADRAGAEPAAQRCPRSGDRRDAFGQVLGGRAGVSWAWPGSATAASCRSAGLIGSSLRWSRGVCEAWMPPLRMVWSRSEMSA
ncbi:hypothetical protein SFIMM107S_07346 [Streptomyces griseus]